MKIIHIRKLFANDERCVNCGSADDIIPWDNGWLCRDCGYEWG
jgi:hypothetical protein